MKFNHVYFHTCRILVYRYRDNVKKLSVLYKDQPDDPMKRGIYWVEYVMRHQGRPFDISTLPTQSTGFESLDL